MDYSGPSAIEGQAVNKTQAATSNVHEPIILLIPYSLLFSLGSRHNRRLNHHHHHHHRTHSAKYHCSDRIRSIDDNHRRF